MSEDTIEDTGEHPLNPEHWLVPYQTSSLPPGPWLVFAPHADDETFGMGGALLQAREQGIETHVVVVTDGSLGGPAGNGDENDKLVAIRQQEVKRATDFLGVKSLTCWPEKDRGLRATQGLVDKTATAITGSGAASVFFPGPLELHPDHRMTAQLVWRALQKLQGLQFKEGALPSGLPNAFSYEISVQSPVNLLIDITSQLPEKRKAMAFYDSQNNLNAYPDLILALNRARTFTLPPEVGYAEAFYRYTSEDLQSGLRQAAEAALARYW